MKTINCRYGKYNLAFKSNAYGEYYEVYDSDTNDFKGELHGVCQFGWRDIAEFLVEAINKGEIMM